MVASINAMIVESKNMTLIPLRIKEMNQLNYIFIKITKLSTFTFGTVINVFKRLKIPMRRMILTRFLSFQFIKNKMDIGKLLMIDREVIVW